MVGWWLMKLYGADAVKKRVVAVQKDGKRMGEDEEGIQL
jgi:hypothetical protein